MKQIEDKIKFESRAEIESLLVALEQWKMEHKAEQNQAVNTMIRLLDYMHLCW